MNILTIAVALAITAILAVHITLFILFCEDPGQNFISKLGLATGIIYEVLGLLFLISGILLLRKIKHNFRDFYISVRCKLWSSAILLSCTLLLRGTLNILRFAGGTSLNDEIIESENNNTYFAPLYDTFFFVFGDMLPITAQLLSMIFGLIRRNQAKYLPTGESDEYQQSQPNTRLV